MDLASAAGQARYRRRLHHLRKIDATHVEAHLPLVIRDRSSRSSMSWTLRPQRAATIASLARSDNRLVAQCPALQQAGPPVDGVQRVRQLVRQDGRGIPLAARSAASATSTGRDALRSSRRAPLRLEPAAVEAGLLAAEDWTAELIAPAGEDERPGRRPGLPAAPRLRAARRRVLRTRVRHRARRLRPRGQRRAATTCSRRDGQLPGIGSATRPSTSPQVTAGRMPSASSLPTGGTAGASDSRKCVSRIYGDRIAAGAPGGRLRDGMTERIATDRAWRSAGGLITAASLYDGETHDARLERDGCLAGPRRLRPEPRRPSPHPRWTAPRAAA